MEYKSRCIKFDLPDGACLDLLEQVLTTMAKWKQHQKDSTEAAGFLLGYQNKTTGNITIADITEPQPHDFRARWFCMIKDVTHYRKIKNSASYKNFYIGVWHTHPQAVPEPSAVDWNDWNEAIHKDKSGASYLIFIILGTSSFRVWIGDPATKDIIEIQERPIVDGVYLKGE